MPRTFSRGTKFTSNVLFDLYDNFLRRQEQFLFESEAIERFCRKPPAGLIEIDPLDLIEKLLDLRKGIIDLRLHFFKFHKNQIPTRDLFEFDRLSLKVDEIVLEIGEFPVNV